MRISCFMVFIEGRGEKKRKNKKAETTVPFKVVLNVYQGSITAVEDKGVSMRVSELNEEKFQWSNKYLDPPSRVTVGNKFKLACTIDYTFLLSESFSRIRIYWNFMR